MYVVEGNTANILLIRDPKSTYRGAFQVDYKTVPGDGNATALNDYTSVRNTAFFEAGVNQVVIPIQTANAGGITISGTDTIITGLETAELFYVQLIPDTMTVPDICASPNLMSDYHPAGAPPAEFISNPPEIPVVILDQFTESPTSHPHPPAGHECDFTEVAASVNSNCTMLTVNSTNADEMVKVWNSSTGELLGGIPVAGFGLNRGTVRTEINVQKQFNEHGVLNVTYESCGCCVNKTYICTVECSIDQIDAALECCEITTINAELICCEITAIQAELICCSIDTIEGELTCDSYST